MMSISLLDCNSIVTDKVYYVLIAYMPLTLHRIPAGSTSGRTCCRRELATHWSHTAHTAAVDFHRAGSTVPTDCTQPESNREENMGTVSGTFILFFLTYFGTAMSLVIV